MSDELKKLKRQEVWLKTIAVLLNLIIITLLVIIMLFKSNLLHAKDFGSHGHTWEITETNIIEFIQSRLKEVDMEKLNQQMADKTKGMVEQPKAVGNIEDAKETIVYYHDPTYTVLEDILDHNGKVLYPAGYKVNPLNQVSLRQRLIFINGDNKAQVTFALAEREKHKGEDNSDLRQIT